MLKDLTAFLEDDALEVPIDGKVYRIPSPNGETGLLLVGLAQLGEQAALGGDISAEDLARVQLDDEQERDFVGLVLGTALDEMVADGVSWMKIQKVGQYAFIYFAAGEEKADRMLTQAASGEAPAPNRATRRKASRAGATTTKPRASTAGTTSPRKPSPRRKAT